MTTNRCSRAAGALRIAARLGAGLIGLGVVGYATYAGVAWLRYGRVSPSDEGGDPWLDAFMPSYEVVERHHTQVDAPADLTLAAAREQELLRAPVVRSVFTARELILRSTPSQRRAPEGLLAQTLSMGWRVLADVPGREVVVGAVTRPWEANVVFRGIPPEQFVVFDEPGYVKIIWSLRANPIDANHSIFRTETRAVATDSMSRARFRVYWSLASPGIRLIRRLSLTPLKAAAERRYELTTPAATLGGGR